MELLQSVRFAHAVGGIAPVDSAGFWFAMHVAMLAGFATASPVNWLLIHIGRKEKM
ncbi:DUF4396 domain-containing protein [Sphingomonas sp. UYP23]